MCESLSLESGGVGNEALGSRLLLMVIVGTVTGTEIFGRGSALPRDMVRRASRASLRSGRGGAGAAVVWGEEGAEAGADWVPELGLDATAVDGRPEIPGVWSEISDTPPNHALPVVHPASECSLPLSALAPLTGRDCECSGRESRSPPSTRSPRVYSCRLIRMVSVNPDRPSKNGRRRSDDLGMLGLEFSFMAAGE